jgi:hypothetical protein
MNETRIEKLGGPENGGFVEVWHCPQPEVYQVIRQHWTPDYNERHIYEVKPSGPR